MEPKLRVFLGFLCWMCPLLCPHPLLPAQLLNGLTVIGQTLSLLLPLTKGMSPLEVTIWLEKFEHWFLLAHGPTADDKVKATELQIKRDLDWFNVLKGSITWESATYAQITEAISSELLVQDPKLTRRASLFGLSIDKGKILRDFMTQVERGSIVCYLSVGLNKEEIIVLCILRAIPGELRSKELQHFMDKEPGVQ